MNPWGSPWRYWVPCEPASVVRTRCMWIWRTAHSTSSYMCILRTTYGTRSYDTLQRIEEDILSWISWIFNITHKSRQHVSYSVCANWDSDITGPMSQLEVWTLIHKPSKVNCLFYTVDVPKAIRHYDPLVLRPKLRWYIHSSNQPSFLTVFTLKWWWDYKWYSSTVEGVNRFKTFVNCLIHSSTNEIVKQKASPMVWQ